MFSLKYEVNLLVSSLSASREVSRRYILVYASWIGMVQIMVIGLWSDRIAGSMVELVNKCRSDCDRNR